MMNISNCSMVQFWHGLDLLYRVGGLVSSLLREVHVWFKHQLLLTLSSDDFPSYCLNAVMVMN